MPAPQPTISDIAFELALNEVKEQIPYAAEDDRIVDAVRHGIGQLAAVGERDPSVLARFGAARGMAAYRALSGISVAGQRSS